MAYNFGSFMIVAMGRMKLLSACKSRNIDSQVMTHKLLIQCNIISIGLHSKMSQAWDM